MLPIKDENELIYYLNISIEQNLSRNDLRYKIKTKEYECLDEKTKNKLISVQESKVVDFVKDPVLIKNSNNYTEISEKILRKLIL
ncbi:MAG: hypothetical protein PUB18_05460 [bacterium]|nr:hypothetical protein [bacterium]